MKTQVIPAQITTVEDKIAGNLNLTQILILMVPIFWTTIVYAFFFPTMKLAMYKIPLVLTAVFICLILAMRIKGKVVVEWLAVLLKFNTRPKFYVFNKNESYLRTMDLPVFDKKPLKLFAKSVKKEIRVIPTFDVPQLAQLENLIASQRLNLSFKTTKKGGFHVAFEQIQK